MCVITVGIRWYKQLNDIMFLIKFMTKYGRGPNHSSIIAKMNMKKQKQKNKKRKGNGLCDSVDLSQLVHRLITDLSSHIYLDHILIFITD